MLAKVMRIDFNFAVGTATETVVVTSDASQDIKTETSDVGQVINGRQVSRLAS